MALDIVFKGGLAYVILKSTLKATLATYPLPRANKSVEFKDPEIVEIETCQKSPSKKSVECGDLESAERTCEDCWWPDPPLCRFCLPKWRKRHSGETE